MINIYAVPVTEQNFDDPKNQKVSKYPCIIYADSYEIALRDLIDGINMDMIDTENNYLQIREEES